MNIEINTAELSFFRRQLEHGSVVLFAGAGFSAGAESQVGGSPPLGRDLAKTLCERCGWEYDDDDLSAVYSQAALHLGTEQLNAFLKSHYARCKPSKAHLQLPLFCWNRIYTTNIDDVIENAYQAVNGQQELERVVCPTPVETSDVFLRTVACVHLHGCVLDLSKPLVFSPTDFARETATPSPWYQELADDMYSKTVLFIGTRLAEPMFHHYLAMREKRQRLQPELRAKSFLVSEKISRVRQREFRDQNIVPVEATAEDFFDALMNACNNSPPSRDSILQRRYPHEIRALRGEVLPASENLLRQFEYVSPERLPGSRAPARSLFFMGAEPTWDDIRGGIPAERTIFAELFNRVSESPPRCVVLLGYAGSGKSTTMMRVAFELARTGRAVYYFRGEDLLNPAPIISMAAQLRGNAAFLFIDAAASHFRAVLEVMSEVSEQTRLTLVLADQTHRAYPRLRLLEPMSPVVLSMPELTEDDARAVIKKLAETGFLGVLERKPLEEQISAFMVGARKQLLVALREATSGKGFDAILTDEFTSLADDQAKIAYTIVSLAAKHNAPGVRRRHLLACLDGDDIVRGRVVGESLAGVVIPRGRDGALLAPRHQLIGRFVAEAAAPEWVREAAIVRFLKQIAGDIYPESIRRRVPEYVAYRGIINCDALTECFERDYEKIVSILEQLRPSYGHDFLFWLQYGRVELEFEKFDLAEKDLNQSLAIQRSHQTLHHMGVFFMKKACALDYAERDADVERGERLLLDQIAIRGSEDAYPYAAYLHYKLKYLQKVRRPDQAEQLQDLFDVAKDAKRAHPRDDRIGDEVKRVQEAYLMQTVKNRHC